MRLKQLFPIAFVCAGVLLTPACKFRATPNPGVLASEPQEASAGASAMPATSQPLSADAGKVRAVQAAAAPSSNAPVVKLMAADAGAPSTVLQDSDAGVVSGALRQRCDAELASCIIADPLGYDVCLRMNAEHGCPAAESTGATTSTPVLDDNGHPISQACQAELASCIMRLPTPENAADCTETARKCK